MPIPARLRVWPKRHGQISLKLGCKCSKLATTIGQSRSIGAVVAWRERQLEGASPLRKAGTRSLGPFCRVRFGSKVQIGMYSRAGKKNCKLKRAEQRQEKGNTSRGRMKNIGPEWICNSDFRTKPATRPICTPIEPFVCLWPSRLKKKENRLRPDAFAARGTIAAHFVFRIPKLASNRNGLLATSRVLV